MSGLLTTSDLHRVDGLPADIKAVDGKGLIRDDADLRSPCGTSLGVPHYAKGASIGLQSTTITGVQSVLRPTSPTAKAFLDGALADATMGCPAWDAFGQHTTLDAVIPKQVAPRVVDQQLGALLTIVQEGQTAHGGVIYLRAGDRLSLLVFYGASPIEAKTLEELVVLAAARLGQP